MATTFYEDTMERRRMLPLSLGISSPDGVLTQNVQPGQALPMTAQRYREMALRLAREAGDIETAEPDLTSAQEYLRKRSEGGDMAMLNALAAQFAGERFEPVQAQFLKRAASAREPMKLGSGFLTPQGEFVRDTFAEAERKAAAKARQAQGYEQMATSLELAEQRRQDQLSDRQRAAEFRQTQLDLQQQGLDLRRTAADAAGTGKAAKAADSLRTEYLKRSDKIQEGIGHGQNVIQMLSDPTIATDPTKQVGLIFSFGKMLDPDSVVRESEYALIANARGLSDTLQQLIPRIQTGARLSPQQLKSMSDVANNLMSGANARKRDLDSYYSGLAQRRGVDPGDVLPSYRAPTGTSGADLAAAARAELERRQSGGR